MAVGGVQEASVRQPAHREGKDVLVLRDLGAADHQLARRVLVHQGRAVRCPGRGRARRHHGGRAAGQRRCHHVGTVDVGHAGAVRRHHRVALGAGTGRHLPWRPAGGGHAPDLVLAVVAAVRREHQAAAVRQPGRFAVVVGAGGQFDGVGAVRRHRPDVVIALGGVVLEGDPGAVGRPYRRGRLEAPVGDANGAPAAGRHHPQRTLVGKHDALAVGRRRGGHVGAFAQFHHVVARGTAQVVELVDTRWAGPLAGGQQRRGDGGAEHGPGQVGSHDGLRWVDASMLMPGSSILDGFGAFAEHAQTLLLSHRELFRC